MTALDDVAAAPARSGGRMAPPSFGQARLWFLQQLDPARCDYNVPVGIRIAGPLDTPALHAALDCVAARHESLRTRFTERGGVPLQVIDDPAPVDVAADDLDGVDPDAREHEALRRAVEVCRVPIDLADGPPLRAALFRIAEDDHLLVLSVHHIVFDAASANVLTRELCDLYGGLAAGSPAALAAPPVQFRQVAARQRRARDGASVQRDLAYWRSRLDGCTVAELPVDHQRGGAASQSGATCQFELGEAATAGLRSVARDSGATFAMVLLAAFAAVLHRSTGAADLTFATAVSGRDRPEYDDAIGFFVNTLVLRTTCAGDPTFLDLVAHAREVVLGAYAHQDLPFDELVDAVAPGRDHARNPLAQIAFQVLAADALTSSANGTTFSTSLLDNATSKFDVSVNLRDEGAVVSGTIVYAADLFDRSTVERLAESLVTLASAAAEQPGSHVSELPMMGEPTAQREVGEWAQPAVLDRGPACSDAASVLAAIERHASLTPDAAAIVDGAVELSYRELSERSGQLAAHLASQGVGRNSVVGVYGHRSAALTVALVAVWKAGGAYLPLDPDQPGDRLAFMTRDAGAVLVLAPADRVGDIDVEAPVTAFDDARAWPAEAMAPVDVAAHNLAYVVYTSGSTGTPKGVGTTRGNVDRLVFDLPSAVRPGDGVMQAAPVAFDASTLEIWGALANGATCVALPPGVPGARALAATAARHRMDVGFMTVALFNAVADADPRAFSGFRALWIGGEAVSSAHARAVMEANPGLELVNVYGPTECTSISTWQVVPRPVPTGAVPIGRALPGNEVYVLDGYMEPVPPGVPGELFIGGPGLARGYLGRAGLTADRFVPHPFSDAHGARLYRTGDRVRRRADGSIDFLGRVDRQVKLRGFRIELGEIEAALTADDAVAEAVVVVRQVGPGDQRLVAYVVGAGPTLDETAVRDRLRSRLPGYMVPNHVVALPALPLTPNGKVDRAALPEPTLAAAGDAAPASATEAAVAGVFGDVLGLAGVGADTDFFDAGGHSLLAAQVVTRVRDMFGCDVPLRALFEGPTVAAFAAEVERSRQSVGMPDLVRRESEAAPLSHAQQRLWFLDQLVPDNAFYNSVGAWRVRGPLDVAALSTAVSEVVARHEALRTAFEVVDGAPVQRPLAASRVHVPVVDVDGEAGARAVVEQQLTEPFDITSGRLLRARLARLAAEDHVLVLATHHIASDGWSFGVICRELNEAYSAARRQQPVRLEPLEAQYADFAVWQRSWLEGAVLDGQLAYWRDRLAGAPSSLDVAPGAVRPAIASFRGGSVPLVVPAAAVERLRGLARDEHATLFMVLLAAVSGLLARHSGTADVCVGTPTAGRNRSELERMVGFFVNTLVMRTDCSGDPTFRELVARARATALGAYANQDVPFDHLVEALAPARDASRNPLVQVVFQLFATDGHSGLDLADAETEPFRGEAVTTRFDLEIQLEDGADGVRGAIAYATDLFDRATAEALASHLVSLIEAASVDPDERLSELALDPAAGGAALMGDAPSDPAAGVSVVDRIAAWAARDGGRTAIVDDGVEVSYAELERRSGLVAARLRSVGVGRNDVVAVLGRRGADLTAALLGVWKAGAGYLPLDPDDPDARIALLVEDADARVVVTVGGGCDRLPADRAVVRAEEAWADEDVAEAVAASVQPGDLAYVIYTSGSTGVPKGVAVPHSAVARLVTGLPRLLREGGRVLQAAPVAFDASTFEMWGPLAHGGACVVLDDAVPDPAALGAVIARHEVDAAFLTTALFNTVVDVDVHAFTGLRSLWFGGEASSAPHIRQAVASLPGLDLVNVYGPTECTTFATFHLIDTAPAAPVPIGRPIGGTEAFVLDPFGLPVPAGVAGELCLGGAGLAWGYVGRPSTTAAQFVPHPFSAEPGARLYRTGDRVRLDRTGALEFLGRLDDQVKIRGHRIEPGEVAAALRAHPLVADAVAVVRELPPGHPAVVAYATAVSGSLDVESLAEHLRARLPQHLVPAAIVPLDVLPLTANGKVDRAALPDPLRTASAAYTAPRTATEEVVAALFATVLECDRVGVDDDFFSLGGHSLLATRLVTSVREAFACDLPLRTLFDTPTVADIAAAVDSARTAAAEDLPPLTGGLAALAGDGAPLSFGQQRLWFLEQLVPGSAAYVMRGAWRLRGHLRPEVLAAALGEVVARHDALRTAITDVDGKPVQHVVPAEPRLSVPVETAGSVEEARARAAAEAMTPFDLAAGRLLRARIIRLAPDDHVLVVAMHHIASDGWSFGVLLDELSAIYEALAAGRPSPLPALDAQYADFAVWQRSALTPASLDSQLSYWRDRLAGAPPVLELPTDRPRPSVPTFAGGAVDVELPADAAHALRGLAQDEAATLYMVLLASFSALLARLGAGVDVTVGSPIAGRTQPALERMIGFFVNTLVLRADCSGDPTFRELVGRVRETALDAYAHQDLPFEQLVDELAPTRDLSRNPLVQTVFQLFATPQGGSLRVAGVNAEPFHTGAVTTRFDLEVQLLDTDGGVRGAVLYAADLFDRETAERLTARWLRLLSAAAADPDVRLSELGLLDDDETAEAIRSSRGPRTPIPFHSVADAVAAAAEADPHAPALDDAAAAAHPGRTLDYGQLVSRADALAARLRSFGVGPGDVVGVVGGRSTAIVVALLAVWRAGGAYLPIDESAPAERVRFMLADAGAQVVLAPSSWSAPEAAVDVIVLDDPIEAADDASFRPHSPRPGDLAYVMYTSGSTGAPKGVAVPHEAVARLAFGLDAPTGRGARVLHAAPVAFDASTFELWAALANGGTVVVLDDQPDPAALARAITTGIDAAWLTAALFNAVVDTDPAALAGLRELWIGGEALSPDHVRRARQAMPGLRLVNGYGPTECTTFATSHPIVDVDDGDIPIGRPIANTDAFVLDGFMVPVPAGVPGELFVGGPGLARGYWGRPSLTAERFVPHPFSDEAGMRLYRTGDRVRTNRRGELEFLGRLDHQVKVRGFRIEPGEIEAALMARGDVAAATVVLREDGPAGKRLVAYVVPAAASSSEPDPTSLRDGLRAVLPDYMVPAAVVVLAALPLNANGKVDRDALPAPVNDRPEGHVEPATPTEKAVAAVWADVLEVPAVGADENFFDLGGHSLLATQVVTRLRREFSCNLPVRALFDAPTVAELAAVVDAAADSSGPAAITSLPRSRRAGRADSPERSL